MGELFIQIREPGREPRRLALDEGPASVGRTKQNAVVVVGANVSRQHCLLERWGEKVTVENVSKNGTRLNGKKLEGIAALSPGDKVLVGDVELVYLGKDDGSSIGVETASSSSEIAPTPARDDMAATDDGEDDDDASDDDDDADDDEEDEDDDDDDEVEAPAEKKAARVVIPTPDPDILAKKKKEPEEKPDDAKPERKKEDEKKPRVVIPSPGERPLRGVNSPSAHSPPPPSREEAAPPPSEERPAPEPSDEQPVEDRGDGASDEAPLAARVRRPPLRREREAQAGIVGIVVTFFLIGFGVAVFGTILTEKMHDRGETQSGAATPRETPSATPSPGASETPAPRSSDTIADATNAHEAWQRLGIIPADKLALALDDFARKFPEDARASEAAWLAVRVAEVQQDSQKRTEGAISDKLLAEADRLESTHELSRARAVLDLIAAVASSTPAAETAAAHAQSLSSKAREELATLRGRVKETLERDGPVRALVVCLDGREKLRNLGVDDEANILEQELEDLALKAANEGRPGRRERGGRGSGTNLREPLDLALKLDLDASRAHFAALLLQPLTVDERLHVEWSRMWCDALTSLFDELLRAIADNHRPAVTVRGALRGVVVKADRVNLTIEASEGGGEATLEWPWKRLEPAQVLELLEPLAGKDEPRLLALSFFALATGHEERGHGYLIDIIKRRAEATPRISSFLAIETDSTIPEGGYVVFEGRLVPPKEKDRILEERKRAREEAIAAKAEIARNREKPRLLRYLQRAIALCDDGYYLDGRAVLEKLASKGADIPGVGDAARARLDAPYLRRRQLLNHGPCANRCDFYVLGDGYPLDDDKQRGFDRYADSLARFVQRQDFFVEYDSYMNYWAANVASKDEGCSKDQTKKDTPFGGAVNGGIFTVSGGLARAMLELGFPNEHDGLAWVIGNIDAPVATAGLGGGVAAIPKNFLQAAPHEMGHAFASLGDEYEQNPAPGAKLEGSGKPPGHVPASVAAPNVVAGSEESEVRAAAPWQHWLKLGDQNWTTRPVDVFEGAFTHHFNFWRPQRACVMRDVGSPYCVACMEQMVLQLYGRVRPIDRTWPAEPVIKHQVGKDLVLRIALMAPRTHTLETKWHMEPKVHEPKTGTGGSTVSGVGKGEIKQLKPKRAQDVEVDVEGVKIPGKDMQQSLVVVVEAWDPTPWVQKDDEKRLHQTFKWTVDLDGD